ncbi:MAG: cupin domain-containing protein [Blastocatellia bacterium]|nr:cupin domain-containing protein [Blastocatellia bacterium]
MHSQTDVSVCTGTTSNTWNPHIHWQELPPVKFNERFTGKRIDGENVMIVFTEATPGFSVPTHCHESEQITMVQSGSWLFNVAGREFTAKAGDVVHIPAGWEHSAMALENSVAIEVFTPPRSEWEDEADQYLWGV